MFEFYGFVYGLEILVIISSIFFDINMLVDDLVVLEDKVFWVFKVLEVWKDIVRYVVVVGVSLISEVIDDLKLNGWEFDLYYILFNSYINNVIYDIVDISILIGGLVIDENGYI